MKKRLASAVSILLIAAVCLTGCGGKYVQGTVSGDTWTSEWLGMRFTCPDGMSMDDPASYSDDTVTYELAAYDALGGTSVMVMVQKTNEDVAAQLEDIEDIVHDALGEIDVTAGETTEKTLGGVTFTEKPCVMSNTVASFCLNMYCLSKGGYAVGIIILSPSEDDIRAVESAFEAL